MGCGVLYVSKKMGEAFGYLRFRFSEDFSPKCFAPTDPGVRSVPGGVVPAQIPPSSTIRRANSLLGTGESNSLRPKRGNQDFKNRSSVRLPK